MEIAIKRLPLDLILVIDNKWHHSQLTSKFPYMHGGNCIVVEIV